MSVTENTHHLRRERYYIEAADGMEAFFYMGYWVDDVPAKKSSDVDLVYHSRISWQGGAGTPLETLDYPNCPDCGGLIQWAEAGAAPGSRQCVECGAYYVDTTYGVASEVPN